MTAITLELRRRYETVKEVIADRGIASLARVSVSAATRRIHQDLITAFQLDIDEFGWADRAERIDKGSKALFASAFDEDARWLAWVAAADTVQRPLARSHHAQN